MVLRSPDLGGVSLGIPGNYTQAVTGSEVVLKDSLGVVVSDAWYQLGHLPVVSPGSLGYHNMVAGLKRIRWRDINFMTMPGSQNTVLLALLVKAVTRVHSKAR